MKFDDVLEFHCGKAGRYQWFLVMLLTFAAAPTSFFTIAVVFIGGGTQEYQCTIPETTKNLSLPKHYVIPREVDPNNGEFVYSKCEYYDHTGTDFTGWNTSFRNNSDHYTNQTERKTCGSWEYNTQEQYSTSLLTQYELTCQKQWFIPLMQSLFFTGWLFGNFIFGSLSDSFGRMTVLPVGFTLMTVIGLAMPYIPNYYAALVFKFALGFVSGGTYTIAFVLCLEFSDRSYRAIVASIFHCGFNGSLMIAAGIAYGMKPVNHLTFQIILGCIPAVFILFKWIVPESPRWLVSRGRFDEAKELIRKIAKWNRPGRRPPSVEEIRFAEEDKFNINADDEGENGVNVKTSKVKLRRYTVLDLFRTPNIRRVALASFIVWFASSLIFYGFLFISGGLGADVYINTCISGATGCISAFVCVPFINKLGRRATAVVVQVVMTIALLVSIALVDKPQYEVALIVIVTIGKFCNILVFDAIYLHSAEMFPTCIRSLGVGMGSTLARVGALLAPLIANMTVFWLKLPMVVFAAVAVLSTLVALLLPETLLFRLPETIEDGEEAARFSLRRFFPLVCKGDGSDDDDDDKNKAREQEIEMS